MNFVTIRPSECGDKLSLVPTLPWPKDLRLWRYLARVLENYKNALNPYGRRRNGRRPYYAQIAALTDSKKYRFSRHRLERNCFFEVKGEGPADTLHSPRYFFLGQVTHFTRHRLETEGIRHNIT